MRSKKWILFEVIQLLRFSCVSLSILREVTLSAFPSSVISAIFFDSSFCAVVYVAVFLINCLSFSLSLFGLKFFFLQQKHNIR